MLTTTGGRDARAYYALLLRSTVKERSIFVLIRLSTVMCQLGAGACLPAALLDRIYVALHGASRFECTTLQVASVIWVPDPWIRNALCHLVLELFTEIGQGACHLAQIV